MSISRSRASQDTKTSSNNLEKRAYAFINELFKHKQYELAFTELKKIQKPELNYLELKDTQFSEIIKYLLDKNLAHTTQSIEGVFLKRCLLKKTDLVKIIVLKKLARRTHSNIKLHSDIFEYFALKPETRNDLFESIAHVIACPTSTNDLKLRYLNGFLKNTHNYTYKLLTHENNAAEKNINNLFDLVGTISCPNSNFKLIDQLNKLGDAGRAPYFQHLIDAAFRNEKTLLCSETISAIALAHKDKIYAMLLETVEALPNTQEKIDKLNIILTNKTSAIYKIFQEKRGIGRYFTCGLFKACSKEAYGTFNKIHEKINFLTQLEKGENIHQHLL